MISYEDIKRANEATKTTDIKGKDYVEVNQRIKAFRMVYPTGTIYTEMASNENGVCVFRATVGYDEQEENLTHHITLGTGTAYEKENSSFINKTSYIENCETSAVGRALGMAGFGIDVSVASYEEVANAIEKQKEEKTETRKASVKQIELIKELVSDVDAMLKYYKVNSIEDLTIQQASDVISRKKKQSE